MKSRKAWVIGLLMAAVSGLSMTVFAQDDPDECGTDPNPPVEFSCEGKRDGNYKNPNDCCSYIACSNGRKYIMPCPAGLHWDWTSKEAPDKCDDQYQGQCLGQCTVPAEAACLLDKK